jgi:hypothetical protein
LDWQRYDFIVCDTAQWLPNETPLQGTRQAWEMCHTMIIPVPEKPTEYSNVVHAIGQFKSLGNDSLMLLFPNQLTPLQNARVHKEYVQFVRDISSQTDGRVPPAILEGDTRSLLDFNFTMQFAEVRCVFVEIKSQNISDKFREKVRHNMDWILKEITQRYGAPPNKSEPLSSVAQFAHHSIETPANV